MAHIGNTVIYAPERRVRDWTRTGTTMARCRKRCRDLYAVRWDNGAVTYLHASEMIPLHAQDLGA